MNSIIFLYHSIINYHEKGKDFYCIPIGEFKKQIECLSKNTKQQFTITFDDGLIDNYTIAYPIIKNLGLGAYFFILVSKVGLPGYINWQQLKELRDAGMVIGSHGMTHRILTLLSENEIENELKDSKKILEENLGIPVKYLSIPRGFYNEKIIQKAKNFGYEAVFTSDAGINTNHKADLFKLRRIPIKRSLSMDRFIRIINGKHLIRERVENAFKKTSQKLLGIKNYEKITLKAYKFTNG